MKRLPALTALAVTALLAVAGCGGDDEDPLSEDSGGGGGEIVVGSANFPESALLAEIYAGALDAKDIEVDTRLNIGAREAYIQGIQDGSIDLLPEYTGNLRLYFDDTLTATEPDAVYQELLQALPDGLTVLEKSEAEDKDSVVVTSDTAEEYDLTSIGDLAPVAGDLTLGGPPEWKTRQTGVPGLKAKYDVVFGDFRELDAGGPLTLKALLNGQVDAGNLFTTNPNIVTEDLVALEDPESLFAAQNIVPLIRDDAVTDEVEATLNDVSAALTTDNLAEMVAQVELDKQDPEDVAEQFLADNDLG
jgi:osmoprotectant transport system substrate-binding protein